MTKQKFAEQCKRVLEWDSAPLYDIAAKVRPADPVLADMIQRLAVNEEGIVRYVRERTETK